MVIVRLTGGLGNQMFQYSAARRISLVNNDRLLLDLGWFEEVGNWTPRSFELSVFAISIVSAKQDEVKALRTSRQNPIFRRLPSVLKAVVFHRNQSHIIEKSFHFDSEVLDVRGDVYLDGFWQSSKYFADIEDTIRSDFSFVGDPGDANRNMADIIRSCEAVAVHVRRGDYVTLADANAFHGVCSLGYYRSAIDHIKGQVANPCFFVFSDDISWARENLHFHSPTYYVDHNGVAASNWDMWLMSQCRHHVIANSSFSWWGAWLAPFSEKIVIAPWQWFKNSDNDPRDLLPESWVRL